MSLYPIIVYLSFTKVCYIPSAIYENVCLRQNSLAGSTKDFFVPWDAAASGKITKILLSLDRLNKSQMESAFLFQWC